MKVHKVPLTRLELESTPFVIQEKERKDKERRIKASG
jgi:hypothetical protein